MPTNASPPPYRVATRRDGAPDWEYECGWRESVQALRYRAEIDQTIAKILLGLVRPFAILLALLAILALVIPAAIRSLLKVDDYLGAVILVSYLIGVAVELRGLPNSARLRLEVTPSTTSFVGTNLLGGGPQDVTLDTRSVTSVEIHEVEAVDSESPSKWAVRFVQGEQGMVLNLLSAKQVAERRVARLREIIASMQAKEDSQP
ncbi:MAG: hypothetical protein FWD17_05050 [Polyangiaceae bacterium]|nr:hypothetical protein [Polyangiaceae bacterium]